MQIGQLKGDYTALHRRPEVLARPYQVINFDGVPVFGD